MGFSFSTEHTQPFRRPGERDRFRFCAIGTLGRTEPMKNLRSPLILLFSSMGLHGPCGETDDPTTPLDGVSADVTESDTTGEDGDVAQMGCDLACVILSRDQSRPSSRRPR